MNRNESNAGEPRRYYPLTANQLGVYFEWEKDRESTKYNLPGRVELPGSAAEIKAGFERF